MKLKQKQMKYDDINQWYQSISGQRLANDISESISDVLSQCFGYYAVQIGCPCMAPQWVKQSRVRHQFSIDNKHAEVLAKNEQLPIANDSVDLVMLAHCLAYSKHPHALLREIDRIMVAEAKLIIIETNPYSFWGIRHGLQSWLERMPWTGHLFSNRRLRDWLTILGFKKIQMIPVHYELPLQTTRFNTIRHWLSKALKRWLPFMSAVNVLVYEKSITPLTPIKAQWKQKILTGGRVASSYAGRQSNK